MMSEIAVRSRWERLEALFLYFFFYSLIRSFFRYCYFHTLLLQTRGCDSLNKLLLEDQKNH